MVINPIRIYANKPAVAGTFQLVIAAIGYERRARFAVRQLRPHSNHSIALEFQDRQVHDFTQNKRVFLQAGFSMPSATISEVRHAIATCGAAVTVDDRDELRVWIDISSLTRPLIATICYELWARAASEKLLLKASFVYSHAKFSPPPPDYGPIAHKGAVIPEFAGWSDDPTTPCSAIFGIGYEIGLALGALDDLEPAEAWAFRPTGHVNAYDREIDLHNSEFLSALSPDHIVLYDVRFPLELIARLESLVYGSLQNRRVVIIPFGLKLFALAACLVALQHFPHVNVWRISGETLVKPINRLPNGRISQIDVVFDGAAAQKSFADYSAPTIQSRSR